MEELREKVQEWDWKRKRTRRIIILSAAVWVALLVGWMMNLKTGDPTPWTVWLLWAGGSLVVGATTFFVYVNHSVVWQIYRARLESLEDSESIDTFTGTIQSWKTVDIPPVGRMFRIVVNVRGEDEIYYTPSAYFYDISVGKRVQFQVNRFLVIRAETMDSISRTA